MRRLLLFILICWPLLFSGTICNVVVGGVAAPAVTNGAIGNAAGADDDSDTFGSGVGSYCSFTTTTAGQISYIHVSLVYCYGTPKQINAGLYSSDGSTKLAEGNLLTVGSGAAVAHVALDTPYTLEAATTYRLVIVSASNDVTSVRTTNLAGTIYHDVSFTAGDSLDAALSGTTAQTNYTLRIWATNTSDGS